VGADLKLEQRVFRLQCAFIASVVAFFCLRAEMLEKFGDSPLSPPRWDVEHSRHVRVFNHGQVVIVDREGRLVVLLLSEAGAAMDDPSVVGTVDLIASWAAPQDELWPPAVVRRRLGVRVVGDARLDDRAQAEVRGQFLGLLESWGHERIAGMIRAGEGNARFPRWAGIGAHVRGWSVLVVFIAGLLASITLGVGVVRAMWRRWLTSVGRRESRLRRGLCPGCGYSRDGLAGSVCPECGESWSASEAASSSAPAGAGEPQNANHGFRVGVLSPADAAPVATGRRPFGAEHGRQVRLTGMTT